MRTFDEKCVRVIKAHEEKCAEYAERTVGKAALHNEELCFMGALELAMKAIDTGKSIDEVLAEQDQQRSLKRTPSGLKASFCFTPR